MASATPIGNAPADAVPERLFGPHGGRSYRHFLAWSEGNGFAMAILKVSAPRDRAALVDWTRGMVATLCVASVKGPGRQPIGGVPPPGRRGERETQTKENYPSCSSCDTS